MGGFVYNDFVYTLGKWEEIVSALVLVLRSTSRNNNASEQSLPSVQFLHICSTFPIVINKTWDYLPSLLRSRDKKRRCSHFSHSWQIILLSALSLDQVSVFHCGELLEDVGSWTWVAFFFPCFCPLFGNQKDNGLLNRLSKGTPPPTYKHTSSNLYLCWVCPSSHWEISCHQIKQRSLLWYDSRRRS